MAYHIFILFYQLLFSCFQFLSKKHRKRYIGIKEIKFPPYTQKRVWIHCASAGEYEQMIPLIQSIRKNYQVEICISFFSPSGVEFYELNPLADFIFYLPFDTPGNAQNLIETLQPDYVLWVKYEFWQNIISEIRRRNIPCDLIFADLRHIEEKMWIERNRIFRLLKRFSDIYSTTPPEHLTIKYHLINDGKWKQSIENKNASFHDNIFSDFIGKSPVIIIGSAHKKDLLILSKFLKKHSEPQLKWIIVPHETDSVTIRKIQESLSFSVLYSQYQTGNSFLIVDKTGILKYIYRYARFAWIGGGFDKSVHNTLEAAAYGIPVISGPNLKGMHEAEILYKAGMLSTFRNEDELNRLLSSILKKEAAYFNNLAQDIYKKNAADNYSTSIINNIQSQLFSGH